jgi:hypothetical protein
MHFQPPGAPQNLSNPISNFPGPSTTKPDPPISRLALPRDFEIHEISPPPPDPPDLSPSKGSRFSIFSFFVFTISAIPPKANDFIEEPPKGNLLEEKVPGESEEKPRDEEADTGVWEPICECKIWMAKQMEVQLPQRDNEVTGVLGEDVLDGRPTEIPWIVKGIVNLETEKVEVTCRGSASDEEADKQFSIELENLKSAEAGEGDAMVVGGQETTVDAEVSEGDSGEAVLDGSEENVETKVAGHEDLDGVVVAGQETTVDAEVSEGKSGEALLDGSAENVETKVAGHEDLDGVVVGGQETTRDAEIFEGKSGEAFFDESGQRVRTWKLALWRLTWHVVNCEAHFQLCINGRKSLKYPTANQSDCRGGSSQLLPHSGSEDYRDETPPPHGPSEPERAYVPEDTVGETGRGDAPPGVDSATRPDSNAAFSVESREEVPSPVSPGLNNEIPKDGIQVHRDVRDAVMTLYTRFGLPPPVIPDFNDGPPGANNQDISRDLQVAVAELWSRLGVPSPLGHHFNQALGSGCLDGSTRCPEPTYFPDKCWNLQLAVIEMCFREGLPSPFASHFDPDGDMYIQGLIHDTYFPVPDDVWDPIESDDADALED